MASHLLGLLQLSGSSRCLITSLASLLPFSLFAHSAPGSPTPSVLLGHSKLKGSQSLCLCLEYFFHTSPALSFSSSGLCSNDTYQRPFLPTPYKMPSSTSPLPLSFFFRAFLTLSYLACLFIISFPRKNVSSEDQGPLSGECDSEAGNSVMGWGLQRGSTYTLASCGFTQGS